MENSINQFLSVSYGDGDGYGDGSGDGSGYGSGYGDGYGDGYGYGYGYGDGDGDGYGDGIKSVGIYIFHRIDNVPTTITRIRDNIAVGFILQGDLTLRPCYIIKEGNKFAHGDTLHDAMLSLQEKLFDNSTEEERIAKFIERFPLLNSPYPAKELFTYHHILTGSCRMGREQFCRNKGINIESDSFSIQEFINLTKDQYNGSIILKLQQHYDTA